MIKEYTHVIFQGNNFSPNKLNTYSPQLQVKVLAEYGEIINRGKYKNQPSPYGLATHKIEGINEQELINYIDKLINFTEYLIESGVTSIEFEINVDSQIKSSVEISSDLINMLSYLRIKKTLTISQL